MQGHNAGGTWYRASAGSTSATPCAKDIHGSPGPPPPPLPPGSPPAPAVPPYAPNARPEGIDDDDGVNVLFDDDDTCDEMVV